MLNIYFKKQNILLSILFFFSITTFQLSAQSDVDIWELMNRRDLKLQEIDSIASNHFKKTGKIRGTGYKQYERWKYEMQFHLDMDGYILEKDYDEKERKKTKLNKDDEIEPFATGAWTELGPFSWNCTTSWNPGSGRITAISVYPLNNDIIYITTPGGGIWKSTTGGNQWEPLNNQNNALMDLFSVAVSPVNDAIVFTGSSSGNLFRSLDGGITWTVQNTGMGKIGKILINPTNSQIMYAVGSGIFKSTNGGTNWTTLTTFNAEDIEFKPGNPNILYASGTDMFRSLDAGNSWTQLDASNGIIDSGRTLMAVSPANPQIVYAVQANINQFGRIYRSADGGNTFSVTITGSPGTCTNFFGYEATGCGQGGQASYDMAIAVNPFDADEVHIGGIIAWKSINGGSSFVATTEWFYPNPTGYNHADIHALEWVGNTLFSGSDGGIYKSLDNGNNWIDLSNSLSVRQFYRIANSKTNTELVTGGAQDNGTGTFKTSGWVDWLGADGMDCLISPLNPDIIWGTSQYGSLYRTNDGGNTYTNLTAPATGNWVTPLAIESNSNTIYGGWNGVYKSTDLGVTWTKISGTTITTNLQVLAVSPSNPAYIYAFNGANLYVTTNGGTSWSTIPMTVSITSIAIHPTIPDKIWITSSNTINRVLVSTNAGASFTNISSNLPSIAARSIAVDANEGLYVGMNIGVYYLMKNSTSWVDYGDNVPLVAVNEVELQASSSKLRVATYGRGIWERSIVSTCGIPVSLNATNILTNSATISWAALAGANNYGVDYKINTASTWTNAAAATTSLSLNLTGLTPNTLYDWRVRANCTGGSGAYAQTQFTTTASSQGSVCPGPLDVSTNGTYSGGATIPLNTEVKGTVAIKSDNDYYKFLITKGGTITLSLTTLPANYDLALLKSSGKQQAISQKTGTVSESLTATVTVGTYYARVFPKGTTDFNATSCYTLKVTTGTAARMGVETIVEEAFENKNPVSIYPNPARQNLFVHIDNIKNSAELNIFNLSGKLVLKQQTNEPMTVINISKLNTGMYILNVKDGENFHNLKFIKE